MVSPQEKRSDPYLLHLVPQGSGFAARPADLRQGVQAHYLRLDHVLDFLRAAWAEGVETGKSNALEEVRDAQKSWPMPEPAQALGALERKLSRPMPVPVPEGYERALLALGQRAQEPDPDPAPF